MTSFIACNGSLVDGLAMLGRYLPVVVIVPIIELVFQVCFQIGLHGSYTFFNSLIQNDHLSADVLRVASSCGGQSEAILRHLNLEADHDK